MTSKNEMTYEWCQPIRFGDGSTTSLRPVMRHPRGQRLKRMGDNYGDLECGFCDKVVVPEGKTFAIGTACWNCGAEIIGLH